MKAALGIGEMPFLEHLDELRSRLIWMGASVLVLSIVGFFLVTTFDVIGLLKLPFVEAMEQLSASPDFTSVSPDGQLLFTSPTEPMSVTLKLSFVIGVIFAMPILIYHVWGFMSPALFEREKRAVIPAVLGGFVLFLMGVAMAYFLVLPLGLRFLLGFQTQSLTPMITIGEYLRFATRLILAFGVIFELPLVSLLLSFLGIIDAGTLRRYRRHSLVGVAVLSAILTPADVLTMLMMMGPLVLLYEFSILLVATVGRRKIGEPDQQALAD